MKVQGKKLKRGRGKWENCLKTGENAFKSHGGLLLKIAFAKKVWFIKYKKILAEKGSLDIKHLYYT